MPQFPFPFDATGKIVFPMPLDEEPRETVRRLADLVLLELSALTAAQRITTRAATIALAAIEQSSKVTQASGRPGTDYVRRSTRDAIEKIGPHCTLMDLLLACDATGDGLGPLIVPFQAAGPVGYGAVVNSLATIEASNDSGNP